MEGQPWGLTLAVYHKLYALCRFTATCAHRVERAKGRVLGNTLCRKQRKMLTDRIAGNMDGVIAGGGVYLWFG